MRKGRERKSRGLAELAVLAAQGPRLPPPGSHDAPACESGSVLWFTCGETKYLERVKLLKLPSRLPSIQDNTHSSLSG